MIDNWRKIANKVCGIVLSVTVLGLSGCGKPAVASTTTQEVVAEDVAYTQDIEAMDTVMSLTAYGPNGEAAVKLVIKKKTPTVKVATTSKTISYSKVKSAAQSFKIGGSVTGNGTITYKKTSGSSKITINAKTGAVTVKKGTAKGTYTIKVKVSAAASTNYAAASKTVTIKVVVK